VEELVDLEDVGDGVADPRDQDDLTDLADAPGSYAGAFGDDAAMGAVTEPDL
jgi:hypothetical protein